MCRKLQNPLRVGRIYLYLEHRRKQQLYYRNACFYVNLYRNRIKRAMCFGPGSGYCFCHCQAFAVHDAFNNFMRRWLHHNRWKLRPSEICGVPMVADNRRCDAYGCEYHGLPAIYHHLHTNCYKC